MTGLLTELSTSPGVSCVLTPFGEPLGSACPQQPADQGDRAESGRAGGSRRGPPRRQPS